MKVLFLVEPISTSASTRFRVEHFLPHLHAARTSTTVRSAVIRGRLENLISRTRVICEALASDVIVIQRHLYSARAFDWLRRTGKPIVFDFDDALFTYPTGQTSKPNPSWMETQVTRLNHTLANSSVVIAGSRHLASYASRYNPQTVVIPTSVKFLPSEEELASRRSTGRPVVGWIGRAENLIYLRQIADELVRLQQNHPFTLRIVSNEPLSIDGLSIENRVWALDREEDDVASFDIGLAPLADDAWSRGKCGLKAIQSMACGQPVVVSPIGAHRDIVRHNVNGLWATDPADWSLQLGRLLREPDLRRRIGVAARQTVADEYSVDASVPKLQHLLLTLTDSHMPNRSRQVVRID